MQNTEVKTIVPTLKGTLCLSFSPNPKDQGGNTICGAYGAFVKSPRVSPLTKTDKFPWEERRRLAKSTFPLIKIDISELSGG